MEVRGREINEMTAKMVKTLNQKWMRETSRPKVPEKIIKQHREQAKQLVFA